jgi:hypothetical protein
MKLWRQRGKQVAQSMRGLLESAAAGQLYRPTADPDSTQGAIQRSAVAALSMTLQAHNITVNRILATISQGLDAEKLKVFLGEVQSQADMPQRLRASDIAVRLLEAAGELPSPRRPESAAPISVTVVAFNMDKGRERTIDAEPDA